MRPIKKQPGTGISIRLSYFRGHFMGVKRGFVAVVNVSVLYWSSKIQANGAKGLVSVLLPNPMLPPRTEALTGLGRGEGRWSDPDGQRVVGGEEVHGAEKERVVRGKANYWRGEGNVPESVSSTLQFPLLSIHESPFFWKQMCFTGFTLAW